MYFVNGSKVTMTYDVRYCTISSSEDGRTIGRYFDEDEKLAKIM